MTIHLKSPHTNSSLDYEDDPAIQPNAIDLRIDKVWQMQGEFTIDEETKNHRKKYLIEPDCDGYYKLQKGTYEISMQGKITMGHDEGGFIITRSTLNRNGCFLSTGWFDSGYEGSMGSCLHVNGGPLKIKRGTRVGQFLLWKSETLHQYDGDYGVGKEMEKQYQ